MKMRAEIGEVIWMVDGTRKIVVSSNSKSLLTEDGIKVPYTRVNRQHKTGLLLEIQDGVHKFN